MMKIEVQITDSRVSLPSRAHDSDTGYDVCAAVDTDLSLEPGVPVLVPTGIRLRPLGTHGILDISIRPRSGWSSKGVLVSLGTIDFGYRGDCKVCMINLTREPIRIPSMAKIGQLVFSQRMPVELVQVSSVEIDSTRAESGFGSTGF